MGFSMTMPRLLPIAESFLRTIETHRGVDLRSREPAARRRPTRFGLPHAATVLLEADREALGLGRYEYLLHLLYQRSLELRQKLASRQRSIPASSCSCSSGRRRTSPRRGDRPRVDGRGPASTDDARPAQLLEGQVTLPKGVRTRRLPLTERLAHALHAHRHLIGRARPVLRRRGAAAEQGDPDLDRARAAPGRAAGERRLPHPSPHVLLAPGGAGRDGEGHPGARRPPGPHDDAAVHAPVAGAQGRGDPAARPEASRGGARRALRLRPAFGRATLRASGRGASGRRGGPHRPRCAPSPLETA